MSYNSLYYGSFYDTTIQSATANTPTAMTLNTTDVSQGVSIVSSSQITVARTGIYNIAFSAQLENTSGGSETIAIWLKLNGNDLSNTATEVIVANNGYLVAAWNFFVSMTANQYVELYYACSNANLRLFYQAATTNPPDAYNRPAIPSLIVTANKVN